MPKAKPDQVIVHRIELQKSEREALEAALAGKFVTNGIQAAGSVLSGIGNMLAPFGVVFGALAALWIGDRTFDAVKDDAKRRKAKAESDLEETVLPMYTAFSSYINAAYADNGPRGVVLAFRDWPVSSNDKKTIVPIKGENMPTGVGTYKFLAVEMITFVRWWISLEEKLLTDERYMGVEPGVLWDQFYPLEQAGKDAYFYTQQAVTTANPMGRIFGWA